MKRRRRTAKYNKVRIRNNLHKLTFLSLHYLLTWKYEIIISFIILISDPTPVKPEVQDPPPTTPQPTAPQQAQPTATTPPEPVKEPEKKPDDPEPKPESSETKSPSSNETLSYASALVKSPTGKPPMSGGPPGGPGTTIGLPVKDGKEGPFGNKFRSGGSTSSSSTGGGGRGGKGRDRYGSTSGRDGEEEQQQRRRAGVTNSNSSGNLNSQGK